MSLRHKILVRYFVVADNLFENASHTPRKKNYPVIIPTRPFRRAATSIAELKTTHAAARSYRRLRHERWIQNASKVNRPDMVLSLAFKNALAQSYLLLSRNIASLDGTCARSFERQAPDLDPNFRLKANAIYLASYRLLGSLGLAASVS